MSNNVERRRAAERRGWMFAFLGAAGRSTEGQHVTAAQATQHRGQQFIGEGDDPLGDVLDKIEAFRERGLTGR